MRIVCFHLNQVGDLAFSLPALKCVRDSFPGSHITSVARPILAQILDATGLTDDVLDRPTGLGPGKLKLARVLRSGRYDLAVVFSQSAECAILAYLSRAPERIGFVSTSLGALLTHRVEFHHPPSTANNLRLIEAAGCRVTKFDYVGLVRPPAEQSRRAEDMLARHGIAPSDVLVSLAPGASSRRSVKEWTDEGFAAVAAHVLQRGARVAILGTQPADGITSLCPGAVDLSGETSLGDVLALAARSRVLVAVDSGILHLAAAAGTKVVGLYGPSDPRITGPQGDGHVIVTSGADCAPCIATDCRRARKCMLDITAQEVIDAVDAVLGKEAAVQ